MQKQKKQASALAVAIICLGLFLIIALSVSLVSLSEKKAATGISKSNLAYQIANAGVEKVLQSIKINQGLTIENVDSLDECDGIIYGDEGYKVELKDQDGNIITDCSKNVSEIASVKSTGTFGQNQRAVSVVAAAETPTIEFGTCTQGAGDLASFQACQWRICLSTTNCSDWYGEADKKERIITPASDSDF